MSWASEVLVCSFTLLLRPPSAAPSCPINRVFALTKPGRTTLVMSTIINGHGGPSNGVAAPGAEDGYTNHTSPSTSAGISVTNGYAQ